jgi:hemolysin activation/secretion protein
MPPPGRRQAAAPACAVALCALSTAPVNPSPAQRRLAKPALACLLLSPLLLAPPALAQAPAGSPPPDAAAAPATATPIDILEYQVEGNSVLPVSAIERALEPHLGPGRAMKDVETAREALEAAYQKAGYLTVLVDIPEQRIEQGIVRLAVLEGRVGALYVSGSRWHDQGYIRQRVAGVAPGSVPNFNEVQQQLASVNRSEDRRVQPVLKPGRLPGTVDVDLQVEDKLPMSGSAELNNQHSRDTDELRASATLRYDNLFQRDHSLSLTLVTAPTAPEQSQVAIFNYGIPLDGGDSWSASLTWSGSDIETLGGTQVLSRGTTFGLRRHIAWPHASGTAVLSLGADYKNLKEKVDLSTPLRYIPWQVAYADGWQEADTQLQLNLGLSFAIGRLLQREVFCPIGAGDTTTKSDQFACKRYGASPSFGAFKADGRWNERFGGGQLRLRLGGQLASGPLVSAEQYSLGGAETVRGYLEGEASGDHGVLGSIEWRTANLIPPGDTSVAWRSLSLLAFAEGGATFITQALPGQDQRSGLVGTGFGLRLASERLEASLDFARAGRDNSSTPAGDWRAHARLSARF